MAALAALLGTAGIALLVWGGWREMKRYDALTTPITHQPVYVTPEEMKALGWRQVPGKPHLWVPDLDLTTGDNHERD